MATSGRCTRCDCEGNTIGCEMCFYTGFKCPGNCKCCADPKVSSTKTQSSASSSIIQTESTQEQEGASSSIVLIDLTQEQEGASESNDQKEPTPEKKRSPLRPLILRSVKKALSDKQKAAACSNVSQSKEVNSEVKENNPNEINSEVKENNPNEANTETQTPEDKDTYKIETTGTKVDIFIKLIEENKVEPEPPASRNESANKGSFIEYEEYMRLWKKLFWAQYDKLPCPPPVIPHDERKPNILTKEKLQEGVHNLIGDQCLNCNCRRRDPRDPCDICRRTDFQCLGTCLCCANYRSGQRLMIFVTRGLYKLSDGSIYGGGNVNLSNVVQRISELSEAVKATISAFSRVIFIALNRYTTLLSGMLMNMRQALLSYF